MKLETDSNFSFCETPTPNKSLTKIEDNKVDFKFGGNLSNLFSLPGQREISNLKTVEKKLGGKKNEKKKKVFDNNCKDYASNRLFSNDLSDFSVSSFPRDFEPDFEDRCNLKSYK